MKRFIFAFFCSIFLLVSSVYANEQVIGKKAQEIAQSSKIFILNFAIDELYKKLEIDMQTPYIKAIVVYDYMMEEYIISSYKDSNGKIIHGQSIPKLFETLPSINLDINQEKAYTKTPIASLTLYYDPSFFSSDKAKSLQLSKIEKEYLKSKKTMKICIDPNWLPFEAIDEDGKHIGMSADILKIAQEKSNITFELIKTKSWSESLEFIKNNRCDMLPLAMKTDDRSAYLNFTKPYIKFPFVVLTNHDKIFIDSIKALFDKKVSMVKDYAHIEIIKRDYPQIEIVEVNSLQQGIDYIREGKVYGHVDALAAAAYKLQKEGITDVKIVGKLEQDWSLSIAMHSSDSILLLIMQKVIDSVPKEKIQSIQNQWLAIKFEEKIDYSLVYKILVFFSFVFAVALWRYYEIKKVNKIILEKNEALNEISKEYATLAITDRLTNLYNRYKLDETLISNKELSDRYGSSFGAILIDIDHFKNVNDTFGHQTGDKVLKTFASILLNSVRKSDIVGRWGGEEFLIIVPNATKESIIAFAENLRIEIEKFKFEKIERINISLGATLYQKNEFIDEMMKRADRALYHSKEKGRNQTSYM